MSEDQETQKKKSGGLVAIIILLLIGLAVMAYLWSGKKSDLANCENANQQLQAEMQDMNDMMADYVGEMSHDLKTDLQNMLASYDDMKLKSKEDADSIERQQQEIRDLLEKVEQNKWTARELSRMRKENESLKRIMKEYVVKIDSLYTANVRLSTDLTNTQGELTQTSEKLTQTQQNLREKDSLVKKGSKLQAFNFASTGLRERLNSTMTETNRAGSTEQIKSSFTISENPIAQPGSKTVYMQIVTPEGKTLQTSSGQIISTEKGPIPYSDKKEIDYRNERIDVAIYYRVGDEKLSKGNYKVNIYCQGQLIGSDNFTLK